MLLIVQLMLIQGFTPGYKYQCEFEVP